MFPTRMQNLRFLAVLALLALTMPLAAHADSTTFDIVGGTFQSGGTFPGSLTLDTSTDSSLPSTSPSTRTDTICS
jgi:hypothetical protein